jgi:cell wall-associated NlpC family hydrolase
MAACAAALVAGGGAPRALHVVTVPILDVRGRPGSLLTNREHDPIQETQLLYGERVNVLDRQDAWARIEAPDQSEYTHQRRWQGYPGWVLQDAIRPVKRLSPDNGVVVAKWATITRDAQGQQPWFALPMGATLVIRETLGPRWKVELPSVASGWMAAGDVAHRKQLAALSPMQRRRAVLRAAEQLVGDPYLWGGHSPHRADPTIPVTGVDCSGLVHLAFRAAGVAVPRDAHEQWMRARAVERPDPGDLIFLSEAGNPSKIVHVMLYTGEEGILEAPGTGKTVHRLRITERLFLLDAQLRPGQQVNGQTIRFGSYISGVWRPDSATPAMPQ